MTAENRTAAEDDLTRALEATIAAEQPTGNPPAWAWPPPLPRPRRNATGAHQRLGALLPGVVRSPTRGKYAALEQTAILRDLTDDAGQRALVQLVGAVVTLLGRTAGQDSTGLARWSSTSTPPCCTATAVRPPWQRRSAASPAGRRTCVRACRSSGPA